MACIWLNVGGVYFVTTRTTLERGDTFFRALVKEEQTVEYFVDRDPTHFRYVLNWLRGSNNLPDDLATLQELHDEARFYCMFDLVDAICTHLPTAQASLAKSLQRIAEVLRT